ncbi:hypothetical protein AGMMS49938_12710 [Fibrobacterales bacterium]|nr:hypothetical protein AGMMS49938_12710 [Fibrobacterales bacterium]
MKNCLFFAITAFGFIMQACGDNPKENGEFLDNSIFSNDSTITIKNENNKYFCDFQWTNDYKNWDYDFSGDYPADTIKTNAPWCLVPYGNSTYYIISFSQTAGETHYACRNKDNAFFKIQDENEFPEISIIYDESDERVMKCVALKYGEHLDVTASGGTPVTPENPEGIIADLPNFMDDRLYHIVEIEGNYSIEGHLNLKFVKPTRLKVLFEVFRNAGIVKDIYYDVKNDEEKIKQVWKDYMAKAGYTLEIRTTYVPFPNTWDSNFLTDSMITIPSNGNYADELYKINKYLGTNNYDYVIGVTPGSTHNRAGKKEVFSLDYSNGYANGFVLTDFDFFNTSAEEKARMLSSLLYSKILGKDPLKNQNDLYLSYYTTNLDFSQPSKDWETRLSKSVPRIQMEFALH